MSMRLEGANFYKALYPFRNGLLEKLDQFTREAKENGLRDVSPLKRRDTNEIVEVTFTLNDLDLILVSTTDTLLLTNGGDHLASKILIYFDFEGNDDNTPFTEIVFQEVGGESYVYNIRWFTTTEPKPITGRRGAPKTADREAAVGREAANALINHLYRLKSSWKEKPTLRAMRGRKSENRTLGFRVPD